MKSKKEIVKLSTYRKQENVKFIVGKAEPFNEGNTERTEKKILTEIQTQKESKQRFEKKEQLK